MPPAPAVKKKPAAPASPPSVKIVDFPKQPPRGAAARFAKQPEAEEPEDVVDEASDDGEAPVWPWVVGFGLLAVGVACVVGWAVGRKPSTSSASDAAAAAA